MLEREKMLKLNFRKLIVAVVTATVAFSMVFCTAIFSGTGFAYADAASEGFVIKDYQVDVTVTEDRVYRITENICCDFSESRHGIYRCIPTSFRITRADGSSDKMKARIGNFDANTSWEQDSDYEYDGNAYSYYTVRLGNPDSTVIGEQNYTISYDYICSQDTLKDVDEFYFNIIGSGWDTDINHVTFNIEMPKTFDASSVGYSMGAAGVIDSNAGELTWVTTENSIQGETLKSIAPGEALTIRVELPDGYFKVDSSIKNLWAYIVILILAIVSACMCFKWGRDDKIIPSIQFEPPEGYNSLDVGVMSHLDARDTDILSLLIYLADKGYIKIEPLKDWHGKLEKTKKFCFHKVKEYDGDNICEREFMNGLFRSGSSVTNKELEKHFYKTVQEIGFMEREFTSTLVWRKGRVPITFFILASAALLYLPSREYGGFIEYAFSLTGNNLIAFLIGLACIVSMIVSWGFMQKRTPLGIELAGKARGFAEFIETAEKDRIEQLVEEDPESFYRIIPYAAVLGVTDKWIEKFEDITLPRPSWFMYDDAYLNGYIIGNMLGSTLQDSMQKASAAPESSGGGGISGGGAGGGGGGSW